MSDWGDWSDWDAEQEEWEADLESNWKKDSPAKTGTEDLAEERRTWDTDVDSWHEEPVPVYTSAKSKQSHSGVSGLSPAKNVFVGIAQNVQSMPERQRTFFSAWLDSLIYGVPFVNGKVRNVFNLQLPDVEDSLSITQQRSIAVTFFGEANTGLIGRGQTLQVKGKYGPDHTVFASEIVNLTNGSLISIDSGIPGGVIRVITLVIVLLIASFFLNTPFPGLGNISILPRINWEQLLLYGVLILLGIWWLYNLLRRPSRTTIKVVGAILLLLLLYLVPSVGSTIAVMALVCLGIYIAGKGLFR